MSVNLNRRRFLEQQVRLQIADAVRRDRDGDEQLIKEVQETVVDDQEQKVLEAELLRIALWLERGGTWR